MDFTFDDVAPSRDPLIEQRTILALHDLITSGQIIRDPAADIMKSLGCKTAAQSESLVDRLRITISKVFDDHEEQLDRSSFEDYLRCVTPGQESAFAAASSQAAA